jgi:hypothetical protein
VTKAIARHDYPPEMFPLTLQIYSGKTGELVWSRMVTHDEARSLAKIEIPSYANTEHYPVRAAIVCAHRRSHAVRAASNVAATDVACPACGAWVGWACEGPNYGYHAAGYHPSRQRAADRAAAARKIDLSTKMKGAAP